MRADLRAHLRGETSFKRKTKNIAARELVIIVCEDGKSSPAYFRDIQRRLRLSTAEIEIYGDECGSAPISVVQFAIETINARKKEGKIVDRLFCVVDVDTHTTLELGRQKAHGRRIDYIESSPCFERWYLLHFERGDRPHSNYESLAKQLAKYVSSYAKGTFAQFDVLWAKVNTAISNARLLRVNRELDPKQSAYTDVDIVVTKMISLSVREPADGASELATKGPQTKEKQAASHEKAPTVAAKKKGHSFRSSR